MSNERDQRETCARRLREGAARAAGFKAVVGFDGFVDEILHVVDQRQSASEFTRLPTIARLAGRLASAAGRSTNLELVRQVQKLGGNGPIMANALATLGLRVTYVGCLGYPELHPVFRDLANRAEVHSIANPGLTDALEFNDGKVMLGKHEPLREVTWANLLARWSRDEFTARLAEADLVGFVNWTMLPFLSDIWASIQAEACPRLTGPRRPLFVDLADPEKRLAADLRRGLELVGAFARWFDVTLGLNEKEALEVGRVLGLAEPPPTREGLAALGRDIHRRVAVDTLVIHPVRYALAVSREGLSLTAGPTTDTPKITTGAGDHFNSGFALGKLLGLEDLDCLLAGVTASGFYVQTARSPAVADLVSMLENREMPYERAAAAPVADKGGSGVGEAGSAGHIVRREP